MKEKLFDFDHRVKDYFKKEIFSTTKKLHLEKERGRRVRDARRLLLSDLGLDFCHQPLDIAIDQIARNIFLNRERLSYCDCAYKKLLGKDLQIKKTNHSHKSEMIRNNGEMLIKMTYANGAFLTSPSGLRKVFAETREKISEAKGDWKNQKNTGLLSYLDRIWVDKKEIALEFEKMDISLDNCVIFDNYEEAKKMQRQIDNIVSRREENILKEKMMQLKKRIEGEESKLSELQKELKKIEDRLSSANYHTGE